MKKTYRVDFKPVSPYFFGNEKTFPYTGQKIGQHLSNSYYIKSECMPSQTTVLGALRYLFLAHKKSNYTYSEKEFAENAARVGAESFDIAHVGEQDFGIIESVSPVFVRHKELGILIPTPFDHQKQSDSDKYQPFTRYNPVETPDGQKLYTDNYDVKLGLTDTYMSLETQELVKSEAVFSYEDRVGIAIDKNEKAFFKKKYAILDQKCVFSVYLTLSDEEAVDALKQSAQGAVSVFMGQGKSAFIVSFEEQKNPMEPENPMEPDKNGKTKFSAFLGRKLPEGIVGEALYFASDAIVADSRALYEKTLFSIVKTKDYRAFGIAYGDAEGGKRGSFQKKGTLYRMIAAGSILITSDVPAVMALFENPNAKKIGLNQIVK